MSQQLDRGKPLWETWFVEGLEGDRFAVVSKVHHCMVDGVGGVEMTTATMRVDPGPDPRLDEPPRPFVPRPAPTGRDLVLAELRHRLGGAAGFVSAAARVFTEPRRTMQTVAGTIQGLSESFGTAFRPASSTPLNVEIGPHRRFDWTAMDLGTVKAMKARLGGTVNDVVLAVVSGAIRRYLADRGVDVDRLDFRAMVPVNLRAGYEGAGNRVASVVARLPVDEPDPLRRLARVSREMEAVKHSHQVDAARALEDITDWSFTTLLSQTTRLASVSQPFNLVVTNVPGPQFPALFPGRAPARVLSGRTDLPLPGARDRALQLRWAALLGLQRRLGRGAGSARAGRPGRRRVPAARRRGGPGRHPGTSPGLGRWTLVVTCLVRRVGTPRSTTTDAVERDPAPPRSSGNNGAVLRHGPAVRWRCLLGTPPRSPRRRQPPAGPMMMPMSFQSPNRTDMTIQNVSGRHSRARDTSREPRA